MSNSPKKSRFKEKLSEFMSTHPSHPHRIDHLSKGKNFEKAEGIYLDKWGWQERLTRKELPRARNHSGKIATEEEWQAPYLQHPRAATAVLPLPARSTEQEKEVDARSHTSSLIASRCSSLLVGDIGRSILGKAALPECASDLDATDKQEDIVTRASDILRKRDEWQKEKDYVKKQFDSAGFALSLKLRGSRAKTT